jgi:putative ABC transport system ATP-binding protein
MTARSLHVDRLGLDLDGATVLDQVSFRAEVGVPRAVTGPSGSGKTVLLLVLAGLLAPSRGTVQLDGAPLVPSTTTGPAHVGVILQPPGLIEELTAHENVALPLQARGLERSEVGDRTRHALAALGLDDVGERLVDELSGGQRQRVGVARALAGSPDVLLADEPTAELDPDNRTRILALLSELARAQIVLVASNDPDVIAVCQGLVHLRDGRLVSPDGLPGAGGPG